VLLNEGTVAADDRRVKSVQMECLFQRRRCNGRVPKSYIRGRRERYCRRWSAVQCHVHRVTNVVGGGMPEAPKFRLGL